jgi:hypothetical protein
MKSIISIFQIILVLGLTTAFISCDKDDNTPDKPTVVIPGGIQSVTVGETKDFTIIAEFPGGYRSHEIISANGTVTEKSSQPAEGASRVEFVVSFTGTAAGAGAITTTVVDRNNKTDTNTLALNVQN